MKEEFEILSIGTDSSSSALNKEKKRENKKGIKGFLRMETMSSQLVIASVAIFAFLLFSMIRSETDTLTNLQNDLMDSRLQTDVNYIQDTIGGNNSSWSIDQDGFIKCGDVIIGDGTEETANYAPFLLHQDKTGTFSYVFKKVGDQGLTWVGDQKTGYQQGHYLRVAGSTKNPDGSSIVGTYMDKKVADVLDAQGHYEGPANVNGNQIYCYYGTLLTEDGEIVGAIVVGRNVSDLEAQIQHSRASTVSLVILCLLLSIIGFAVMVYRWALNIQKIENYVDRIGEGELPEDELQLRGKDEIAQVAGKVNEMVGSLREMQRIGGELSVATDIQANMLPKVFPDEQQGKYYGLYATMTPAKEVGGDLYDFFLVDKTHLAIVVADVSGKGVPAALFMVIAKTLIKDHTQIGMAPNVVFNTVNDKLCVGNEVGLFVTAWMGIVDLTNGEVRFVNAGHNPPVLMKKNGETVYLKTKPGIVLAAFEGFDYTCESVKLNEGDKLYLYTDGVTEATDANDELYGEDRLLYCLQDNRDKDVEPTLLAVKDDIDKFVGEAEQFDDMTMLMFEMRKFKEKGDIVKEKDGILLSQFDVVSM